MPMETSKFFSTECYILFTSKKNCQQVENNYHKLSKAQKLTPIFKFFMVFNGVGQTGILLNDKAAAGIFKEDE